MDPNFLAGVIEGFYGQPWSQSERFELFDWMARWGLNTYLYAPKDDLKHRAIWREPYSASEQETLHELISRCKDRNLRFIYGLSPGLDIRYGDTAELEHLKKRFAQIAGLGCQHFALLFDDISEPTHVGCYQGSLAAAQSCVANTLHRQGYGNLIFCPTAYCGRMAERKHGGEDYLPTLGRELAPEIDVFWTGPEIISREIPVAHIQPLQTVLHRKPLIWDNSHANDYDGRRFYCGPYAGRPAELRGEVRGIMANPNNEFPLNYVPLRTFAEFVHCKGTWDARKAYLSAMKEWLPHFATVGEPVALEDLILFGDCYYLPHEEGPEAEAILQVGTARRAVRSSQRDDPTKSRAVPEQVRRLRDFCARMNELRDRSLFYALSRRVWELREELDFLMGCSSDSHLPGTFRGGMVARLQRLVTKP